MIKLNKIPLILKFVGLVVFFALSLSPLFPTISQKNNFPDVFSVRFIPLLIGLILLWITLNFPLWLKATLTALAILGLTLFLFIQGVMNFNEPHQIINIVGDSMSPTYKNGAFLMTKVLTNNDVLRRDDVISFKVPKNPLKESLGRVIGLPGDIISIKEGVLTINEQQIDRPYVPRGMKTNNVLSGYMAEGEKKTMPPNSFFILGDNRKISTDSRLWGPVPGDNIENKVIFCIWNCR